MQELQLSTAERARVAGGIVGQAHDRSDELVPGGDRDLLAHLRRGLGGPIAHPVGHVAIQLGEHIVAGGGRRRPHAGHSQARHDDRHR